MVKLFIEGGGNYPELHAKLREAFHKFLLRAGFGGRMPRIVAGTGRYQTYDKFKSSSISGKEVAILLIDSECAVDQKYANKPWQFLKDKENWDCDNRTDSDKCHLMVQIMESWFFADKDALSRYYGASFDSKSLSFRPPESMPKNMIYQQLNQAVSKCKTKTGYDKGRDSFEILSMLDVDKVKGLCPWAERFLKALDAILTREA